MSISNLIEESRAQLGSGDFASALRSAQRALAQANSGQDPEAAARALVCAATAEYRLGHYPAMRDLVEQALAQAGESASAQAEALNLLGIYAMELGRLDDMETCFLNASDLARRAGDEKTRFRTLHNLSLVYGLRGQFDLSNAADEEAYQIAQSLNLPDQLMPLIAMFYNFLRTGDIDQAARIFEKLTQSTIDSSLCAGYTALMHAYLCIEEGDVEQSLPVFAQARSIAEKVGDPALQIFIRLGLSRCCRLLGQAASALEWAGDGVAWSLRSGNIRFLGRTLLERARAAWLAGDLPAAAQDLSGAIAELEARGQLYDLACARLIYAALLAELRSPQAREAFNQAARQIVISNYTHLLDQERGLAYPLISTYLDSPDPETAGLSARCLEIIQRHAPAPLKVRLMGDFEIRRRSKPLNSAYLRQRRAGELMRLLLISPKYTLARDAVIEALWPGKPPGACQALFHQATSTLRRALEPELPERFPSRYLSIDEGLVTLHLPPGSQVDFEEFEAWIRAEDWEKAATIYAGELCPFDRYADWAAPARERLRRLYLQALMISAKRHMAGGCPREALQRCTNILEIDAWQEEAVLLGMQACLVFHARSGAIRLYQELERALRRDLDTSPGHDLRAFYESLF